MLARFTPALIYFKSHPSFFVCLKFFILAKHTKGHHNPQNVPSRPYPRLPFALQLCDLFLYHNLCFRRMLNRGVVVVAILESVEKLIGGSSWRYPKGCKNVPPPGDFAGSLYSKGRCDLRATEPVCGSLPSTVWVPAQCECLHTPAITPSIVPTHPLQYPHMACIFSSTFSLLICRIINRDKWIPPPSDQPKEYEDRSRNDRGCPQ